MSSQGEILAKLKKIYSSEHDPDVLNEIRRYESRINGFKLFHDHQLFPDQLDAIHSIAKQYGQAPEVTVKYLYAQSGCITQLWLHAVDGRPRPLTLPDQLDHLRELDCRNNHLTSVEIPYTLTALEILRVDDNDLIALTIPSHTSIKKVFCARNHLTAITISAGSMLRELWCGDNQLTHLSIPSDTPLEELSCEMNHLSALSIPKTAPLRYLECRYNPLTSVTIPNSCHEVYVPRNCRVSYY